MRMKNQGFDMPWQVATTKINCGGLIYQAHKWVYRIEVHVTLWCRL